MKHLSLSILLILVFSLSWGQESALYTKLKDNADYRYAYLQENGGVVHEGLIKDIHEWNRYGDLELIFPSGKRQTFTPKDLAEYRLPDKRYVSDGKRFYEVAQEGKKVGLYRQLVIKAHSIPSAGGGPAVSSREEVELFYLKKNNEKDFKLVKKSGFAKTFSTYFADCETVRLKIKNKELTDKDFGEIAYLYNKECQK